jgi:hypothetical protein
LADALMVRPDDKASPLLVPVGDGETPTGGRDS